MPARSIFDTYQNKITACDEPIEKQLSTFGDTKTEGKEKSIESKKKPVKKSKNAPSFDLSSHLMRMVGVDLTTIPGLESYSVLKIISEIGLDLSRWKSSKQFASWLGLCPGNKVSGGKRLSGKSKRTGNNAASTLRMSASTLHHSHSALGAFFRRMKARIGAPKATTATAHKLAVIIFNMIRNQIEYAETGEDYYEKQYRDRLIKNLSNRAKILGFELTEIAC